MTRIGVIATATLFLALLHSGCGNDPAKTVGNSGEGDHKSKTGSSKTPDVAQESPAKTGLMPSRRQKTKPPVLVVDSPGRRLTAWVLKKGGSVAAYIGKKQSSWTIPVELPPGKIEPHLIKLCTF